jgi:pimeloyl-ACP methyl ester carboxylesterase
MLLHNLLYIIIGAVVLLVTVYFIQDKLIFKPEKLPADFQYKYDIPFRELFFDITEGVRINGLHFYREHPAGLILYLHGNTRSIKGWAKYARDFYRFNYDVVLVDYRGFGKSTGPRSEAALLGDMQHVYEALLKICPRQFVDGDLSAEGTPGLLVYGRSIGSGFAAKLAADNDPRYLILDSPYYNFTKVVQRFIPILPVRYVLRYHLRTDLWLPRVRCHTYILHGTRDWLIPIRHSQRLQKLNPSKVTLIRIQGGGHNNLTTFPEYHNFIRDILKE